MTYRLSGYDYAVIGFYGLFLLAAGWVFRRMSRTTSAYFRADGIMPGWLTGTSAWARLGAAWLFVGAASETYRSGLKVVVLFYAPVPALVGLVWWTGRRFRRMRVTVWTEAVRERFGPGTERFYTWIKIPLGLAGATLALLAAGVFIGAASGAPVAAVVATLGAIATANALGGGAFAVLAGDFVQTLLVAALALVVTALTLHRPDIGGPAGLIDKVNAVHPEHLRWWLAWRPAILVAWALALAWGKFAELNSPEAAAPWLAAKGDRDARRTAWIALAGVLLSPLLWLAPALAAEVLFPDLSAVFPSLARPSEGAWLAVATQVLPAGWCGLLVAGLGGLTITGLTASLNQTTGLFVRSLYRGVLHPHAPEPRLLRVSRGCTTVLGLATIAAALALDRYRTGDLFTLLVQLATSVALPVSLPLLLGLFYKRTPGWSAWLTTLAGLLFALGANLYLPGQLGRPDFLRTLPEWVSAVIGLPGQPLSLAERADLLLALTVTGTTLVSLAVFFGSSFFFLTSPIPYTSRVERCFASLRTPVEEPADTYTNDESVVRRLAWLCFALGGFVLPLALFAGTWSMRLGGLFVALVPAGSGAALHRTAQRQRRLRAQYR